MEALTKKRVSCCNLIENVNITDDEDAETIVSNQKKEIKRVVIVYTGGTIGCQMSSDGLKPIKNFLFEYMKENPYLCDKEYTQQEVNSNFKSDELLATPLTLYDKRIYYKIINFEETLDSSNMNLNYWIKMGKIIKELYDEFDSFLFLHGTDTMHYTTCYLSFMLEHLGKTVILTGAQVPLFEMANDGQRNLMDALIIAGSFQIPEVTLLFNGKLFRGNRAIKNDNYSLDAFCSPNLPPLVTIGRRMEVQWNIILPPPSKHFQLFTVLH